MEIINYLEDFGGNGTEMDLSNQSVDPVPARAFLINGSHSEDSQDIKYPFDQPIMKMLLFLLYSTIFILSFFGNLAVVIVTTLHRGMRKITTFWLLHLAIANLCVGIFCVYQNMSLLVMKSWILGDFMCKMYFFIMNLSYTVSILILVVIAFERYVVIMRPMEGRWHLTIGKLQIIITMVWIVSGVICFHCFYTASTSENFKPGGGVEIVCSPNVLLQNQKAMDLANFLFLFLVPLFVIFILCTRAGFFLRRHSRSFRAANVTPLVMKRSPLELETLDRLLRNLTPPAVRKGSGAMTFTPVVTSQREGNARIVGTGGRVKYSSNRCSSSKCKSSGSTAIQIGGLQRSRRLTESNEIARLRGLNVQLSAASFASQINSNGLLTSEVAFREKPQRLRLTCSDLVLNSPENQYLQFSGVNKMHVVDVPNSSFESDPSQINCRSKNLDISRSGSLMERRDQTQNRDFADLKISRTLNSIQRRNHNNSLGLLCLRRAKTLNESSQTNSNHKAVILMLTVTAITFALCNFPFHLRKMCQNYFSPCSLDHPLFELVTPATFLSMYANSAINPFIYVFIHRRYRACLVELFAKSSVSRD